MLFVCTNKREVTQDSNIHILDREDRWFERSKIGILRSPRTSFFEQRRGPQTVTTSQPHPWDLSPEESTITHTLPQCSQTTLMRTGREQAFFQSKTFVGVFILSYDGYIRPKPHPLSWLHSELKKPLWWKFKMSSRSQELNLLYLYRP